MTQITEEPQEMILTPIVHGWRVGHHAADKRRLLIKLIPSTETVDAWTHMVTLLATRDATVAAEPFIADLGASFDPYCTKVATQVWPAQTQGGYSMQLGIVYCEVNRSTGIGEVVHVKVTKSEKTDALYVWQYARKIPGLVLAQDDESFTVEDLRSLVEALRDHRPCILGDSQHSCPKGIESPGKLAPTA
ncbi:MAG: hypothetical protein B7733_11790 [Myxococcales bacterium FL481]|nr:MAG: hypothetical protein B7733_11790 [Myxococcales bacterium FL481]